MATTRHASGWGKRISSAALLFSAVGMALALGGAFAAYFGIVEPLTGFKQLFSATYLALAGGALALVAMTIHVVRHSASMRSVGLAFLISVLLLVYVGMFRNKAQAVPAIHDISTDLADPPTFTKLPLREDNLAVVPDGGRADMKALAPAARVAAWQREAYPDIGPLTVTDSVADTVAKITDQAKALGWSIAVSDPAAGRVEATETVSLYRFKDDIVFRVHADPADPARSIVDARSVSRVGVSDVGVNARRIRAALAKLKGQ